jgi:hypothetical protein
VDVLTAPYILEYTYRRSLGSVLTAFVTGLRDGKVLGVRASDGRVLVPPQEYDPVTSETLSEMVEVSTAGTVTSWTWQQEPAPDQPLDRPFGWALILLDGADTAMAHAVSVSSLKAMKTGMRVKARFRPDAERGSGVRDIECFVPETITELRTPVRLEFDIEAGPTQTEFLRAIQRKVISGSRFEGSGKTYVPMRTMEPTTGERPTETVEVAQSGILTTFAVINIPFEGQRMPLPYVCGAIVLDGVDLPIFHIVAGISPDDIRMGMRVRAVWADDAELAPTLEAIRYFEPTGEPDAEYDAYSEHL